jgi:hypothetical protein
MLTTQGLSQNEKLKADYNYEKFKETFNKEMEKLEEGRKIIRSNSKN